MNIAISNAAVSCIADTLRLLLEEAKQAQEAATAAKDGGAGEGFECGRSEALAEALHTWANQLQTFGLETQLKGTWEDLSTFLARRGY
jgi:hypothetical protein